MRAARLNLAASLSGNGGREEEAVGIAQELQQELDLRRVPAGTCSPVQLLHEVLSRIR